MTSLLSGRHKYLTNKNTKKGRRCCKKLSLRERPHFLPLKTGTALSPQAKAVQHPVRSRFFEMISFFLHSVSANLMIAKKRGNARKTPEIVRFRGFEAMISFEQAEGALNHHAFCHQKRAATGVRFYGKSFWGGNWFKVSVSSRQLFDRRSEYNCWRNPNNRLQWYDRRCLQTDYGEIQSRLSFRHILFH